MAITVSASSEESPNPSTVLPIKRMMSVDALRGFDMFWIIGADALVYALKRIADGARGSAEQTPSLLYKFIQFLATQLDHAAWAGFHFYDLIFPMFVFIMGVSLVFSLTKQIEIGGRVDAMKRLLRRFGLMFVIALLYSGGFTNPWPDMRLLGVLNRIALCYLFGGLIFIFFKPKAMIGIAVALLVGYWGMMNFVPIRDIQLENLKLAERAAAAGNEKLAAQFREGKGVFENEDGKNFSSVSNSPAMAAAREMYNATTATTSGKFEPGLNVANHFDFKYLPGKKWDVYWDPEGILSTMAAVGSCLLGVFAGLHLKNCPCEKRKVIYLISAGFVSVLLGFIWGLQFPVVKKIWSSSFVLVAGGYSAILLGIFYYVIDVLKWQTWCQPFVWMGANSIAIYLTSNAIGGFRKQAQRFVGGDVKAFFETSVAKGTGDLVVAIFGLLLAFLFVRFLYKRKIFLRM